MKVLAKLALVAFGFMLLVWLVWLLSTPVSLRIALGSLLAWGVIVMPSFMLVLFVAQRIGHKLKPHDPLTVAMVAAIIVWVGSYAITFTLGALPVMPIVMAVFAGLAAWFYAKTGLESASQSI